MSGELKKTGVNIMAVTQPIYTNSHAGALQQNIQFIFSKYDNDLRRQKTIDGMREKLLRGEWIGNAPTGYAFVKGAPTQTIIISEKGEAIKQAFSWRANGMTYEQIVEKLKLLGVIVPKQTLTDIFRNPFYCGFMSHNLLNGEVIKGKHPPLIDEDLFLSTIDSTHIEPLKLQLQYTWENLTESNTSEKKALSLKLNEVEEGLYNLRKRHAIGTVSLDVYEQFSGKMIAQKEAVLEQLEKLDQKLSNPKELIHFTCKLAANLAPVWDSGDYYQKQMFQNIVFPQGLLYDVKIEHYRTPIVNDVIGYIAHLSRGLEINKKRTSL
ncbi:MAG: recombinase family protein, partial [Bacteroidia bacterium]